MIVTRNGVPSVNTNTKKDPEPERGIARWFDLDLVELNQRYIVGWGPEQDVVYSLVHKHGHMLPRSTTNPQHPGGLFAVLAVLTCST